MVVEHRQDAGSRGFRPRGIEGAAEAEPLGYTAILWVSPLLPFHRRCRVRSAGVTVLGQAGKREIDFNLVGRAHGQERSEI